MKSTFIEKINWRLLSVHFFATIFIMLAARWFAVLKDIDLFEAYWRYGQEDYINHLPQTDLTLGERLTYAAQWIKLFGIIGLLIAFAISLTICIRKKIFWLNSIIVLLLAYSTNLIGLLQTSPFKTITNFFGDLFIDSGIQYAFILNGGLFAIIGLFIFLNKWINKFVSKQNIMTY